MFKENNLLTIKLIRVSQYALGPFANENQNLIWHSYIAHRKKYPKRKHMTTYAQLHSERMIYLNKYTRCHYDERGEYTR